MKVQFDPNKPESDKYKNLTPGNTYRVIGIEADWFRLMSDEGLPFLYPPDLFLIVNPEEPDEWITSYEDGARTSYPEELNRVGFFEDYFEGDQETVNTLRVYLSKKWR